MPTPRRLPKRAPFDLDGTLSEYLTNRSLGERSKWHEDQGKKALMDFLDVNGELEEGGHKTVVLDRPPGFTQYKGGKPVPKIVTAIKRQRRAGRSLNAERTMEYLKAHNLVDQCTEVVVEINEEAILGANYSGEIPDDVLDGLYDESETFAFIMETEDA